MTAITRALSRTLSRTITRDDVALLPFSNGIQPPAQSDLTVWYDYSDLSTLFQDNAGSTPVTADADPVGAITNLATETLYATQSSASLKPTFKTDGTINWIYFDGTERMDMPNTYDGAVDSDNTAVFALRVEAIGNRYVFGATSDDGFELLFKNGLIRPFVGTSSGNIGGNGFTTLTNNLVLVTVKWDRSAGRLRAWVNRRLEVDLTGTPADKLNGANAWLGQGFSATTAYFNGRMAGASLIYDADLTDTDTQSAESYVATKANLTIPAFYSDMTWSEVLATNASGAFGTGDNSRRLTITNDGGGFGNYYLTSNQSWTSSTGKVSVEFKFISQSTGGALDPFIGFIQGSTNIAAVSYDSGTGGLSDAVGMSSIATISPTIGQFSVSVTLDQAAGTATVSYKLSDSDTPTTLASLTVDGSYNNANPILAVFGGNVATGESGVIEYNSGQELFETFANGEGYGAY